MFHTYKQNIYNNNTKWNPAQLDLQVTLVGIYVQYYNCCNADGANTDITIIMYKCTFFECRRPVLNILQPPYFPMSSNK